jgi:hypothetical protein
MRKVVASSRHMMVNCLGVDMMMIGTVSTVQYLQQVRGCYCDLSFRPGIIWWVETIDVSCGLLSSDPFP